MTITQKEITATEYRRDGHELFFVVKPGKIAVHHVGVHSQSEVEDYVGLQRQCAEAAKLPATTPETEFDKMYAEIRERTKKLDEEL
jgi:hypothetical protein